MKRTYTIITLILLSIGTLFPQLIKAQSPNKISYQAVIRDANNNLITNTTVGVQISIIQNSVSGTEVYIETQTPTTNANGLISLEIGTGNTSDDFSTISWGNDMYFLKTETDPDGGTNYTITGISQLLSVPYALHANTADSITGTITETDPTFTAWDKSTGITITESQISDLVHTVDTDTQLDETAVDAFVANNGYLTSFTEIDGSITNEIQAISLSNDTIFLSNGGFVKLPSIATFSGNFNDLTNLPTGIADGDDDTQLNETQVDAFTANNGYLVAEIDGSINNEIQAISISNDTIFLSDGGFVKLPADITFSGNFNDLTNLPTGIADGDDDTQLNETQVDAFTANNGYLTTEIDGSIYNEIELPAGGANGQVLKTDGNGNYTWIDQTTDTDTDTQLDSTEIAALGYVAGDNIAGTDKQISFNDAGVTGADAELVYDKTTNHLAIGTSTVNPSAALEVNSTTGGFMLPRMTTVQRDALSNPQVGLMIFNTDSGDFQGFAGFNNSGDLTIDHNTFFANLSFAGQSFTAISSGLWKEVRLNFNAVSTGTLQVYAGNTITGTPIHTQPFSVSSGVQGITMSAPIQLVVGQQYTIFVNVTCGYYPFSVYPGGNSFTSTVSFPGDLWMQVITESAKWKKLHD